jgi:hypothetical protein
MNKDKLQVLLHEHVVVNKKIDDFINAQYTYITTLITMSAGFIYFTISSDIDSESIKATIFLPYLIIILGPTFLFKFNRAIILQGYRTYIEDKINENVGENFVNGGKLVRDRLLLKNPFAKSNSLILSLLFIVTVVICNIIELTNSSNSNVQTIFISINMLFQIFLISLGIIYFNKYNKKAFKEGYEFSNNVKYPKK